MTAIDNNFEVTSKTLGSDNIEYLEYTLDFSRAFRIMTV